MRKFCMFLMGMLVFSSWAQKPIATQYVDTEPLNGAFFIGKNIFNTSYFLKGQVFIEKRTELVREYQNIALGSIHHVDFVNPAQICLFYKDFNTVVLLDKELSLIKTIKLTETNPQLVPGFVGMSSQNRLWIWDEATNQLGQLSIQTLTYTALTTAFLEPIQYRYSDVNYFYWITQSNQLYCSDIYGKLTRLSDLPVFDRIQIINRDKILYLRHNQLYYLDLQSGVQTAIPLVEKSISGFFFNTQILSIFTDLEIKNYLITLP
ncbi:hypothetical protein [Flavobacterium sp. NKUCC04_CG]|uniref:hypothetical protein n=1 Tax=Flavobacterium sp. NKUCC04_CG TaxID=2842121 RepID=UPI001C5AB56F|nr:hypothetical protein [Flavobacterium sp. NKUCC04_CG]MBW3518141.1 hypothetical protein [Flavobacterium sp. NKUCC04_CG]